MTDAGATWTDERVDLLKKLWAEGLSAGQIAAELSDGVTRNAVISKAHRLRLVHGGAKGPGTPRLRKPTRPPGQSTAAELPAKRTSSPVPLVGDPQPAELPVKPDPTPAPVAVADQPAEERAPMPLRPEVIVPRSEAVTITELRPSMCRWPLGDPTTPEFRFCGARATTGLPYCPHHAQIAYQPATQRKRLRA